MSPAPACVRKAADDKPCLSVDFFVRLRGQVLTHRAPGGGLAVAFHARRGAPAGWRLLAVLLLGEGFQLWPLSRAACCCWARCRCQRLRRSPAWARARRAGAAPRAAPGTASAWGRARSLCRATPAAATQRPPVYADAAQCTLMLSLAHMCLLSYKSQEALHCIRILLVLFLTTRHAIMQPGHVKEQSVSYHARFLFKTVGGSRMTPVMYCGHNRALEAT
jgi:hypothetical protein